MTSRCIDFSVVDDVIVGPGQGGGVGVIPAHELIGDIGDQGA